MSSSASDAAVADDGVITASCTLLSASQTSDGASPSTSVITLHTSSSQKIVIPVAAVCPSPSKQTSQLSAASAGSTTSLRPDVSETATELAAVTDAAGQKPAAQKTHSSTVVTRRVRFQAKPNISKNARTR